jgi:TRAP-type C4-dicarboxylate transport system permease large subunit
MRLLKENLLVQFSVASFAIMSVLAASVGTFITKKLDANIELLHRHGTAMMSGSMIPPSAPISIHSLASNVSDLQLFTMASVGTAFVILYMTLVAIVWRGWVTINQ